VTPREGVEAWEVFILQGMCEQSLGIFNDREEATFILDRAVSLMRRRAHRDLHLAGEARKGVPLRPRD
jgi:hypothetical protein